MSLVTVTVAIMLGTSVFSVNGVKSGYGKIHVHIYQHPRYRHRPNVPIPFGNGPTPLNGDNGAGDMNGNNGVISPLINPPSGNPVFPPDNNGDNGIFPDPVSPIAPRNPFISPARTPSSNVLYPPNGQTGGPGVNRNGRREIDNPIVPVNGNGNRIPRLGMGDEPNVMNGDNFIDGRSGNGFPPINHYMPINENDYDSIYRYPFPFRRNIAPRNGNGIFPNIDPFIPNPTGNGFPQDLNGIPPNVDPFNPNPEIFQDGNGGPQNGDGLRPNGNGFPTNGNRIPTNGNGIPTNGNRFATNGNGFPPNINGNGFPRNGFGPINGNGIPRNRNVFIPNPSGGDISTHGKPCVLKCGFKFPIGGKGKPYYPHGHFPHRNRFPSQDDIGPVNGVGSTPFQDQTNGNGIPVNGVDDIPPPIGNGLSPPIADIPPPADIGPQVEGNGIPSVDSPDIQSRSLPSSGVNGLHRRYPQPGSGYPYYSSPSYIYHRHYRYPFSHRYPYLPWKNVKVPKQKKRRTY